MKLNKNLLYIIFFILLSLLSLLILYGFKKYEKFISIKNIGEENFDKNKFSKIINNGEKLKTKNNILGMDNEESDALIKQYLNTHKGLFNKKSNIIIEDGDLSLEMKKIIQLIKLNELKLILERINRIEYTKFEEEK